jgi:hypothetical protein
MQTFFDISFVSLNLFSFMLGMLYTLCAITTFGNPVKLWLHVVVYIAGIALYFYLNSIGHIQMVPQSNAKYYQLDIVMKTGFKYSLVCLGKQLNGMKENSSGEWTESLTVTEITKEEYENFYYRDEPKKISKDLESIPEKKSKKTKDVIGFSTVEDFLEGNTKPKKKKE